MITFAIVVGAYAGFVEVVANRPENYVSLGSTSDATFLVVTGLMAMPMVLFSGWILCKESFAWTHYPIRLNRKTRMVHAFRLDGTVLSVPWDEVLFTLGRGNRAFGVQNWDIRGHVLDADGVTVRETFAFSAEDIDHDILRRHWEFLRRYMEEGPEALVGQVEFCMPVAGRREPSGRGWSGFSPTMRRGRCCYAG